MSDVMNTEEATKPPAKRRGRPLAFNQDEALDKALNVFWSRGYEGASMAELTAVLGINKPSIYATFGNKEALFRKSLAKYLAGPAAFVSEAMHEPTARQVAEKFLMNAAEFLTGKNNPRGCMIVQGALTCGQGSEHIQQELIAYRKNYEDALAQRFELAKIQGDLPPQVNSSALAKYLATIHQGMSVQATSGASSEELMAVIQIAMQNWPTNS